MTVIYMVAEITLTEPSTDYHRFEIDTWMPNTEPGQIPAGPLNPVIYQV